MFNIAPSSATDLPTRGSRSGYFRPVFPSDTAPLTGAASGREPTLDAALSVASRRLHHVAGSAAATAANLTQRRAAPRRAQRSARRNWSSRAALADCLRRCSSRPTAVTVSRPAWTEDGLGQSAEARAEAGGRRDGREVLSGGPPAELTGAFVGRAWLIRAAGYGRTVGAVLPVTRQLRRSPVTGRRTGGTGGRAEAAHVSYAADALTNMGSARA